MTPAYEAAEAAAGQPCCAYATSVPSGDAANSLTASPVTGLSSVKSANLLVRVFPSAESFPV